MITLDRDTLGLAEIGKLWLDLGDRGIARISRAWLDRDARGLTKVFDDGMGNARRWRYSERVAPTSEHKITDVPHIRWRYSERISPTQDHNIIDSINRRWRYSERIDPVQIHQVIETLERRWRYSERIDPVSDHDITDAPPRRWRYSERVAPAQIHDIIVVPPKRWRYSERVYPTQVHDIIVAPPKRWRYSERVIPTQKHTVEDVRCDVTITGPDRVGGAMISQFQADRAGDCLLRSGTWSSVIHNRYATRDRGWTSIDNNGLITLDLPAVGGPTIYRMLATYTPTTGKAGTSTYFYFTASPGCSMGLASTSGYNIDGGTEFKAQAQMVGQCEGASTLAPGPWRVSGTADTWVRINAADGEIKGTAPNVTQSYSLDVTWTDDQGTDFTEGRTINVTRINVPCTVAITSNIGQVRSQAEWTAQASLSGDCPAGVWSVQTLSMPNGTQNRTTNNVPWATIDQTGKITFKIPFDVGSNTDYRIRAWWTGTSDTYSGDYILTVLPPVDCHVMIGGPGSVEAGKRWSGSATLDGTECPASVVWDAAGVNGITATPASVLAGDSQKVNVSFTAPNTTGFVTIYVTAEDDNGLIDRGSYGIEIKETVPCDVVLASTSGFTIDGLTSFAGQASTTGDCDGPGALTPGPWSVSGTATTGFGVTIDGNGEVKSGIAPNTNATYDLTLKWTDENGKAFFKSYTITVNRVAVPCAVTVSSGHSTVRSQAVWVGTASRTGDCGAGSWSVVTNNYSGGTANRTTNNVPWATIDSNGLIRFQIPFDVGSDSRYYIRATWTSGTETTTGSFLLTVLPPLDCDVRISGPNTVEAGKKWTGTAELDGTECPASATWSASGVSGVTANPASVLAGNAAKADVSFIAPTTLGTVTISVTASDSGFTLDTASKTITVTAAPPSCAVEITSSAWTISGGDSFAGQAATTGDCDNPSTTAPGPWSLTGGWTGVVINGATGEITSGASPNTAATYDITATYRDVNNATFSATRRITVTATPCAVTVSSGRSTVRSQAVWTGTAARSGNCGAGSWSVVTYNSPSGTTNRITNNVPWATIDSNGLIRFQIPFDVGSATDYRIRATWTSGSEATTGEFVLKVLPPLDCDVRISGANTVQVGAIWNGTANLDGTECPTSATWSASGIAGISATPASTLIGGGHGANVSFQAPSTPGTVTISVTASDSTGSLGTANKTITVEAAPPSCGVSVSSTSGFSLNGGDRFTGQASTTGTCATGASSIPGPWSVSGTSTNWGVKIDGNGDISSNDAPDEDDTYNLVATFTDVHGDSFSKTYTITVKKKPVTCSVGISMNRLSFVGPGSLFGGGIQTNCASASWTVKVYNHNQSVDRGWASIVSNTGYIRVTYPYAVTTETRYDLEAFYGNESSGRLTFSVLPPWDCTISGPSDMTLTAGATQAFQISLGANCPRNGSYSSPDSNVSISQTGAGTVTAPSTPGTTYVSVDYTDGDQVASTSWAVTVSDPDPCRLEFTAGASAVRSGRNYTAKVAPRGNCPAVNTDRTDRYSLSGGWQGLQIGVAGDIWGTAPTVTSEVHYTLTATVKFADGSTASESHRVTVQPPVTGCTVSVTPVGGGTARVVEGAVVTLTAAEDGNCGASGTWGVAVSPSGPTVTIDSSTGGIRFTAPATITGASRDYTVTATWTSDDGSITSSGSAIVTVLSFDCTVGVGGPSYVDAGARYQATATLSGTDCPSATPADDEGFAMSGGWSGLTIDNEDGTINGTAPSPSTDTSYWLVVTYTDGSTVITGIRHRVTVRSVSGPSCQATSSGPTNADSGDFVTISFATTGDCGSPEDSDDTWTISAPAWMTQSPNGASGTAPSDPDDQTYVVSASYSFDGHTAATSHSITVNGDGGGDTCAVTGSPSYFTKEILETFTINISIDSSCGPGSWWSSWGNIANPTATSTTITDYASAAMLHTLSFTWTRSSDGQQFTGSVQLLATDGDTEV